jgi:hypothetical protein
MLVLYAERKEELVLRQRTVIANRRPRPVE